MPTPAETLQSVQASADVNAAALGSVKDQAIAMALEVETWPNSPSKGYMRDQLRRLQACYERARDCALSTSNMSGRVLALIGAAPGPGPDPAPIAWSTGDW